MIMDTIFMMISLRMLKKSDMSFPLSPIFPMQIPNVMKNPIKPYNTEGKRCNDIYAALFVSYTEKSRMWSNLKHSFPTLVLVSSCWQGSVQFGSGLGWLPSSALFEPEKRSKKQMMILQNCTNSYRHNVSV